MDEAQFEQFVRKGRSLHDAILNSIQKRGYTYVPLPEIAPRYQTELDPPAMPALGRVQTKMLKEAEQPTSGYSLVLVKNTKPLADGEVPYQNYIHREGRAILCMSNYATHDRYFGTPERLYWPDLMAVSISRLMAVHKGTPKALETIWRITIDTNSQTRNVLARVMNLYGTEICVENDGFFALLGTDHGKGPARMLATYPEMFGRKIISKARITQADICWFLEEIPVAEPVEQTPNEPSTPSRKEKRKARKKKQL